MKKHRIFFTALIVTSIVTGALAATALQEKNSKQVKRVKRPTFSKRDWDGIYFENLFEEGLVGDRPASIAPDRTPSPTRPSDSSGSPTTAATNGGFVWSASISRSTLEDEIKYQYSRLVEDITTPVKFKSDYGKVHQTYSVLSMLFAIIRQYDGDVRWKEDASSAQVSFERAAANSRVGTIQAYESCKRRRDDLAEMVRGGNFAGSEKPPEDLDWSVVIDRNPIMVRLETAKSKLKKLTSSSGAFSGDVDSVQRESELIAAMALVLARENMLDADDDGYQDFAMSMHAAAMQIVESCKTKDYNGASSAANLVTQSCDNCHGEWR